MAEPTAASTSSASRVSVLIVNLNGQDYLSDCLRSIYAQDYPAEAIEVVLVDNGSTDGSLALLAEQFPQVKVVRSERNRGFAGGNNLAARHATGEYLALLNNDARADAGWLAALVRAVRSAPDVACAAAKILSRDGQKIDFVGLMMNLCGRAFQIDEGLPAEPGLYDEPRELLAPCGGAMLIRRDVFWQVGGFDEDYVAYFEDLDLGWRLWLYGYRVLFVPQAVVYHRGQQTGSRFAVEQRYALSEANALRSVIKNYEDQTLWRVLPFSLFMGVKRSLEQARLDREAYVLGHPVKGDARSGDIEPEPSMTRVATSFLVAIDQVADEMPHLLEKRQRIQAARVRSDKEIFTRFPMRADNAIFPWRHYHVIQDELAVDLGVPSALRPQHGSRLLIITHETIGPKMAGPGIRAWEMACALSERFEVTLAAPGEPARSHPTVRVVGYQTDDPYYPGLDPWIANADVVLAMGSLFVQMPRLRDLGKPAIVDLYDPFELEKLAQSPAVAEQFHAKIDLESRVHLKLEGSLGDFFICASERQRDLWLGAMLAAGRVNSVTYRQDAMLRNLIDVVPFGMPIEPPVRQRAVLKGVHPGIGPDDKVLLWNGGLWQWFDPLTLVDALAQVLRTRSDVKLFFAAGKHFNTELVAEMPIYLQTVERSRELGLLDHYVFFGDWIPYDERGQYLLEADLGISTHCPTLESRFASRTRLLDCIWAGLPVISTKGDPISDMIAERGLGRTVPPQRPDLLAEAILAMLADHGLRDCVAERASAVRAELAWPRVIEPVAAFLQHASFAPDALSAARSAAEARRFIRLSQNIEQLERERDLIARDRDRIEQARTGLDEHLRQVQNGRVMRLLNRISSMFGRG